LECFLERAFRDDAQFSYRIILNLFYSLKTTSFQIGFKFGEQEKSAGAKSGEKGGWGTTGI
jgi:hypothetical protein